MPGGQTRDEMMNIQESVASVVDSVTSPNAAVPTVSLVGAANWLHSLPDIINVATIVYLLLLISHKAYKMYQEWKHPSKDKDE